MPRRKSTLPQQAPRPHGDDALNNNHNNNNNNNAILAGLDVAISTSAGAVGTSIGDELDLLLMQHATPAPAAIPAAASTAAAVRSTSPAVMPATATAAVQMQHVLRRQQQQQMELLRQQQQLIASTASSSATISSAIAHPSTTQPSTTQPSNAQPSNAQPSNAKPSNAQPSTTGALHPTPGQPPFVTIINALSEDQRPAFQMLVQALSKRLIPADQFLAEVRERFGEEIYEYISRKRSAASQPSSHHTSLPANDLPNKRQDTRNDAPGTQLPPRRAAVQANAQLKATASPSMPIISQPPPIAIKQEIKLPTHQSALPQPPQPQPTDANNPDDKDSSPLHDVLQFAGVNLKEESDLILRDTVPATSSHTGKTYQRINLVDPIQPLVTHLVKAMKDAGLKKCESDVAAYLNAATADFLLSIIERCIQVSKARLDSFRDRWEIALASGRDKRDPEAPYMGIGAVKRALVWVEKFEKESEERAAKKFGVSCSEHGQIYLADQEAMQVDTSGLPGSTSTAIGGGGGGGQQKKVMSKKKKNAGEELSAMEIHARKRLTNATALQAAGMGSGKYAWMSASSSSAAASSSITAAVEGNAKQVSAAYGLPRVGMRRKILSMRKITVRDIAFVLEHDKRRGSAWGKLRRSRVGAKLYPSMKD